MKATDFKKGDVIIITSEPAMWASLLNDNCPKHKDIYPFECTIEGIKDGGDYVGMSAGGYGWCLTSLINENKVKLKGAAEFPDKWYIECTEENREILNSWRLTVCGESYKKESNFGEGDYLLSEHYRDSSYYHTVPSYVREDEDYKGYKPITLEQFKEHVLKEKEVMRTISANDAQRIIDIACTTWTDKLATMWGVDIVRKEDISITDAFYKEMRKACTAAQNELFDDIFGADLKKGDWVIGWHHPNEDYMGKAWQILKIEGGYVYPDNGTDHDTAISNIRLATEDEIKRASYPADGTPCLVSSSGDSWLLRYANGNGDFFAYGKKSGDIISYTYSRVLDMDNLPVTQ